MYRHIKNVCYSIILVILNIGLLTGYDFEDVTKEVQAPVFEPIPRDRGKNELIETTPLEVTEKQLYYTEDRIKESIATDYISFISTQNIDSDISEHFISEFEDGKTVKFEYEYEHKYKEGTNKSQWIWVLKPDNSEEEYYVMYCDNNIVFNRGYSFYTLDTNLRKKLPTHTDETLYSNTIETILAKLNSDIEKVSYVDTTVLEAREYDRIAVQYKEGAWLTFYIATDNNKAEIIMEQVEDKTYMITTLAQINKEFEIVNKSEDDADIEFYADLVLSVRDKDSSLLTKEGYIEKKRANK